MSIQPKDFDPMPVSECEKRGIIDVRIHATKSCVLPMLDGKPITTAFRACPREGWLDRFVPNSHGQPYIVNGELARERLFGVVTLVS